MRIEQLLRQKRTARDATLAAALADALAIGRPLSAGEAHAALMRVDRVDRPALVFDLHFSGLLSTDALRAVLVGAWSGAEYPEVSLTRRIWLDLFRMAVYEPPVGPITIYRGAPPHFARGMAWTTRQSKAELFAGRWGMNPGNAVARVYTVEVAPGAVLADIDALEPDGRGEGEIVVDPSMIGPLTRLS